MFSPSLMTFTGAAVNRIEAWTEPSVTPRFGRRLMPTVIGIVGVVGVGSVECFVSGMQFILYFASMVVKQTLRVLRLRSIADRLPDWGLNDLKILAHKTVALATQVIGSGGVILWCPEKLVTLYDFLGLHRHRTLGWQKTKNIWLKRLEDAHAFAGQHPIALTAASILSIFYIARWATASREELVVPKPDPEPKPEPKLENTAVFAESVQGECLLDSPQRYISPTVEPVIRKKFKKGKVVRLNVVTPPHTNGTCPAPTIPLPVAASLPPLVSKRMPLAKQPAPIPKLIIGITGAVFSVLLQEAYQVIRCRKVS